MTDLAPLQALSREVVAEAARRGVKIATAESCTGGLVAAALTEVPGSSAVIDRAFVTYSNAAKVDMLGVPADLIAREGAVSEAVARAMAEGAIGHSPAEVAVAITGIAGPDGGTPEKPVGLVHFAGKRRGASTTHRVHRFPNDGRSAIRLAATREALTLLLELVRASAV